MKAPLLSLRNRAVGFAIVVSILMLGAAALGSIGAVVAPASPAGSQSGSSTVPTSSTVTISSTSSAGQAYTISVGGSNVVVRSSSSPTPAVAASISSGLLLASQTPGDPSISLIPNQGPNGEAVTASGSGFTAGISVTFTISGSGSIGSPSACTANGTGVIGGCTFTVSGSATGYTITAAGSDGGSDFGTASFTITTPTILVSPASGSVGSTYTVTGSGFSLSSGAWVFFNSVIQTPTGGSDCSHSGKLITTDASGGFQCTFSVPSDTEGPHNLAGLDAATGVESAPQSFTVTQSLTFSPSSGDVGTTVTLTGSGFTANQTVTPYFGGTAEACTQGTVTVSSTGGFTCTVTVPSVSAGPYTIAAKTTADGTVTAVGSFTVNALISAGAVTPTSPSLDSGQATTLSANPSGGSGGYTYQWYTGTGSGGCAGTTLGTSLTQPTGALTTGTYYYCYVVTDSNSKSASSAWDAVTVNPALGTPTITPANPTIDNGQSVTFSSSWTGGTPDYAATLYSGSVSTCSSDTTVVQTLPSLVIGSTAFTSVAPVASTYYCVVVTDSSAGSPTASASSATSLVTVNSALVALTATPSSAQAIDEGQSITVSTPATGYGGSGGPYSFSWVVATGYTCPGFTTASTASFSYGPSGGTPPASCAFTVTVTDTGSTGTPNYITETTAVITVDPALVVPTPGATHNPADVGQSVTFSVGVSGGTGSGTYTYQWSGLPTGSCSSSTAATVTCTPSTTVGSPFSVTVVVTDGNGNAVSPASALSFTVDPTLVVNTPVPSLSTFDVSQSTGVTFTVAVSTGGAGPYTYVWTGLPGTCASANSVTITCTAATLATAASGSVHVTVTDGNGNVVTGASASYTVDPALVVPTPGATHNPADVGQSVTFSVGVSGGTGSGTYTYQWSGLPTGSCSSSTAATVTCTPSTTVGSPFSVTVVVTDGNGNAVSPASALSFTVDPTLSAGTASSTQNPVDVNQTATIATTGASGGSGAGTYTYTWTNLPIGCSSSNLASISCTPTATTGSPFTVTLTVKDGNSNTATASFTLTVTADPTVGVTPVGPFGYDVGQTATKLTASVSYFGTNTHSVEWYNSSTSACSASSTNTGHAGLTFTPSTASKGTTYYCAVVSDGGVAGYTSASNSVEVSVGEPLVAGAPTPAAPTIDSGQSITLAANASGGLTPYVNFDWYSTSSSSTAGGTTCGLAGWTSVQSSSSTTYATGSLTNTAYYCYVVTDSTTPTPTTAPSPANQVTVDSQPSISVQPTSATIDSGQTVTLSATVTGGTGTFSWKWYDTGGPISGASGTGTTATYLASAADTGIHVVFTDTGVTSGATPASDAKATSSPTVSVTVDSAPSISVEPTSVTIDSGQTVTLSATVTGGTGSFSWQWNDSTGEITGASGTGTTATYAVYAVDSGIYVVFTDTGVTTGATPFSVTQVTSGPTVSVTVDSAPSMLVQPSSATIDSGQTVTLSATVAGGTGFFSWQWYNSTGPIPGASGTGTTATYAVSANGTGIYVVFTDTGVTSGATPASDAEATSSPTVSVTVNLALVAPVISDTPTTPIDSGQGVTLSTPISFGRGTPTYTCQWLVEAPGATSYADLGDSFGCRVGDTPTLPSGALSTTGTWNFELQVTDSSGTPVTEPSNAVSVTVNPALVAPVISSNPSTPIDSGQGTNLSMTTPFSGGTSTYSCQWLVEAPGATAYSDLGGTGVCTPTDTANISTGLLSTTGTWSFELQVTDSSGTPVTETSNVVSVMVNSKLSAGSPTPSSPNLDDGQSVILTANPSGGTVPYSYQWYLGTGSGACMGTALGKGSTQSTGALASGVYRYCYVVMDSSQATGGHESSSSAWITVTVNSAFLAPGTPTVTATKLDVNQVLAVGGLIPTTGTSTYSWQWLVSINGAAYVAATQCAANSGTGASGGIAETCSIAVNTLTVGDSYTFELQVTDSASSPQMLASSASSAVTVSSALVAGTPTPPSPTIDSGQSITIAANPSGGTSGYTYQWYSGTTASACSALGSPISGAASATYAAFPTTTTYYCYVVMDGATSPETQTSSPALAVTVNSALTAPAVPTVSATSLNTNQALVVTAAIPPTGTPTYSWQWLVSINGGAYVPATQCVVNSGTGASSGATVTCSITADPLTAGDTYAFELRVTDSSLSPETQTSAATPTVTVTKTSSSFPWFWVFLAIALAVIIIASVLVLRRRRPSVAAAPPMQVWEEGPGPSTGGGPAAAAPAYLETPEDVGQAPPIIVPVMVRGPAARPTPPAAPPESGGAESDIAALMAELDKLSGEVQKKTQRPGGGGENAQDDDNKSS